jgi:ABC-2 type transport system ATP-binding protein
MAQDLAIDLAHVAKTYGGAFRRRTNALRGIEMRVHRGEVFGLLGPNGAGKSTLVKILMTVIRPSRCEGRVLGGPVGHKPTLARVGYLPEHHSFPGYLTGAQVIDFFGAMSGVPRRDRRRRSGELLELVGMAAWAGRRLRSYSKGMRQRIGIAQALINDPELVLLDEPNDGVDPVGRRDIRGIIDQLRGEGRTVFINSHLLSELEMVCDRVAILVQGRVASQGTIDELTAAQRGYEIVVEPGGGGAGPEEIIRLPVEQARDVQPHIDRIRAAGGIIRSVRPVRPSLEDLFMQAVTNPSTGEVLKPGAAEGQRR